MSDVKRGSRGPTNHRVGEWHPKAKCPSATVERARALRNTGMTYKAIGAALDVPWRTVADWVRMDTRWSG